MLSKPSDVTSAFSRPSLERIWGEWVAGMMWLPKRVLVGRLVALTIGLWAAAPIECFVESMVLLVLLTNEVRA